MVAVTGASGGVGRAVVREFAKRGDSVALLARGEVGLWVRPRREVRGSNPDGGACRCR